MILHAARRPRYPHDYTGEHEIIHWSIEADDYDTGKTEIEATVREDEVLMYLRVER